jgi:hypothetical protein
MRLRSHLKTAAITTTIGVPLVATFHRMKGAPELVALGAAKTATA